MRRLSGNAGIDARLDGRRTLAVIWFRRAIARRHEHLAGVAVALVLLAFLAVIPEGKSTHEQPSRGPAEKIALHKRP